ncbi:Uncharacterized protein conserved in bacteria [Pragia fontium]|uniref:Uncharacterized conserved protein YecT, DUF1311 family n=1 Tax=Pragia fontium DSM 5563 = ATCC 49100 TaxID=1122977 RepID=A0AAJ5BGB7_9GAMM|nr:lysozyme inhibitor LprI family protein [Pragia fontium]SFC35492.1 Uncharacterized conserved protein YecT, DUF1311 family [Pragia fontium DSM 5563 = ATCC 49100]SUB81967.1 Uncharacterized protein conserved in bacteria [Pragia fontium]
MKRLTLLSTAFLLALSLNVSAEELDCNNVITTPDINACAQMELDKVEKQLNQTYQKVMALINKPDEESIPYAEVKRNLLESQRAWVTFRKKDCDALYALYSGGTIRGVVYLGCMREHAVKRTEDLKGYISYFE